jgi:hypothetical protein
MPWRDESRRSAPPPPQLQQHQEQPQEPQPPHVRRGARRRRAAALAGRCGGTLAVLLGSAAPALAPASTSRPLLLRDLAGRDRALLFRLAPAAARVWQDGPALQRSAIVRRIFFAGDRIARLPYKWGGGHGSFADSGYDCSGSVSYVLHAAGLLAAPEDSGALTGYGDPGPGKRVTVYANSQHALVTVDGRRFDTITLQETGSRWAPSVGSLSGYVMRHPPGL